MNEAFASWISEKLLDEAHPGTSRRPSEKLAMLIWFVLPPRILAKSEFRQAGWPAWSPQLVHVHPEHSIAFENSGAPRGDANAGAVPCQGSVPNLISFHTPKALCAG